MQPGGVVLVEGAMVLESARLRDLMHLKIFVDCDEDVRFMRRLARDTDPHGAGTSLPLSLPLPLSLSLSRTRQCIARRQAGTAKLVLPSSCSSNTDTCPGQTNPHLNQPNWKKKIRATQLTLTRAHTKVAGGEVLHRCTRLGRLWSSHRIIST